MIQRRSNYRIVILGAGVNVGSVPKKITAPATITCPRALELRQLIQYKPLTDEQRQIIVKSLKEYGEYVAKRQEKLDSILPQEPREESEKLRAEELESKVSLTSGQEDGRGGKGSIYTSQLSFYPLERTNVLFYYLDDG